jgi:dual specificity tyrosine-phosphorylation-regulated kinase 2/3/4
MRHPGAKTLWSVLRCKDPGFVDLLEGCLRWDPAERMTPEEAMAHPWMAELREQQQQPANNITPYRCVDTAASIALRIHEARSRPRFHF